QTLALRRRLGKQRMGLGVAALGRRPVAVAGEREIPERDERACLLDGREVRPASEDRGDSVARRVAITQLQLDPQQAAQWLEQGNLVAERLERLERGLVLLPGGAAQARLLVVAREAVPVRHDAGIVLAEAPHGVREPLELQVSCGRGVAEAEVRGRQVVDEIGLRDIEEAEITLADALRLLERGDRLDEAALLDVAAPERSIDLDEPERELSLRRADRVGGLEITALGRLEVAEHRVDHAKA